MIGETTEYTMTIHGEQRHTVRDAIEAAPGLFVFRMPFDEVAGIVSGACGNPAILAYTNKLAPTDLPDVSLRALPSCRDIARPEIRYDRNPRALR